MITYMKKKWKGNVHAMPYYWHGNILT